MMKPVPKPTGLVPFLVTVSLVGAACGGGVGGAGDPASMPGGKSGSATGGVSGGGAGTGGGGGRTGGAGSGTGGVSVGAGGSSAGGGAGGAAMDGGAPAGGGAGPANDAGAGDAGTAASVDELDYLKKVVPIFWITLGGKPIAKGAKTVGPLKVIEEHDGTQQLTSIDGKAVTIESKIGLELRGSSSSYFYAQKPYTVELQDDLGMDRELPLLGMPKESDWVFSSCYSDKSCLRNALSYAIAREAAAASGRWAPRTRWIEVYFDAQYQGLYLLVEKPKGAKGRVNLPRPAATAALGDITGGYMFSADGDKGSYAYNPMVPMREWYDMRIDRRWKHRFPNQYDIMPAQKAYISAQFDALEVSLINKAGWQAKIDPQSWMDYFLVSEFNNNVDTFFRSWFFYKLPDVMGGKFFMGPVWDYDLAFGNANYGKKYCYSNSALGPAAPFAIPLNDPQFANDMKCRWYELRKPGGPLDVARIEAKIDAFAAHIKTAKARDGKKWGNIGKFVWPNNYIGATWEDEVSYLKYWIRKRLSWVDKTLKGQCMIQPMPAAVTALPQPPNKPNDMRALEATAKPPQLNVMTDPTAFIPLDGAGVDPKLACPAP
jgi:hypothetical protein